MSSHFPSNGLQQQVASIMFARPIQGWGRVPPKKVLLARPFQSFSIKSCTYLDRPADLSPMTCYYAYSYVFILHPLV